MNAFINIILYYNRIVNNVNRIFYATFIGAKVGEIFAFQHNKLGKLNCFYIGRLPVGPHQNSYTTKVNIRPSVGKIFFSLSQIERYKRFTSDATFFR